MISFNKYLLVPVLSICHYVYALETFSMLLRLDNVDMLLLATFVVVKRCPNKISSKC